MNVEILTKPFLQPLIDRLPQSTQIIFLSLIPMSILSVILYFTLFLVTYFISPLHMGQYQNLTCQYNQPVKEWKTGFLKALKDSYLLYIFLNFPLNIHLKI